MPPSILIVDDDDDVLDLLHFILSQEGFEVHTATNGIVALQRVEAWLPDLIITDIMMPVMDGFTFIRQLRARPRSALLPVIFLTSANRARNRLQCFKLGADDYLEKPIYRDEIVFRARRVLENAERLQRALRLGAAAEMLPGGKGSFSGDLALFGLGSLLSILEMEGKTGVLMLRDGQQHGRMEVRAGRVVAAELEGVEHLLDAEAIYRFAGWEGGDFSFRAQPVEVEDRIRSGTAQLLLEAARRLDDQRMPASQAGEAEAVAEQG